jgi:hypothetical protein
MIEDSVVREIREARDAYARSLGYDARAIVADLKKRDEQGDWPVVRLAPRPARGPMALIPRHSGEEGH